LISSVVKEDEISLVEVLKILEESKEAMARNKELREKSKELTILADKLRLANQELRSNDRQKDEFLNTVAHELKTPITGIRAATELILDEDDEMPNDAKQQFLKNILQDSDRLSRLIHNILDFEKLSTGRQDLVLRNNNIKNTINKAVAGIEQIAIKKEIKIKKFNLVDFEFVYDEDRVVQVITNLLSNAVKFCDYENGKILISSTLIDDYVEICINDNGKGVDSEDVPYIFNKFYQSKNQNTIKPEGSGLGLAICKQIIEKHNGNIKLKKINKKGTSFVFQLPFN